MKNIFIKIKKFLSRVFPTKRRLIQLYSMLLFNCYSKGYVTGEIFKGITKNVCTPGLICYSCPGAVTSCPLGALQNALSDSKKTAPYYVFGILMLYGVLLGRWICGWLCPFGFVQELLHKIKTPKLKKSIVTRVLSYLKYVILAVFVVILPLIYAFRDFPLPAFCKYICPEGTLGGAVGLLSNPNNASKFGMLGPLFTWKFALMVSIVVGSVFIYRLFCRFLCPLGALYGLFNRISILGIKLEKKSCIRCGKCVTACKMDIRQVGDSECISCGECIPVCPTSAISWKGGSIILPPSEIESGAEKLRVIEPDIDEEEARARIEKKRSKRVKVITASVASLLLALLIGCFVYFNFIYDPGTAPEGSGVGDQCPSLELDLVLSDGTLSVDDLKGQVVVINFWGTWCGPCKAELPHFEALAKEYEGFASFYIVHTQLEKEYAADYINENYPDSKMNWVFDEALTEEYDRYYMLLGGDESYPRTLVLDSDGVIKFAFTGAVTEEELRTEIDKALSN